MRFVLTFLIVIFSMPAFSASHSCIVTTTVQVYDAETLSLKHYETVSSNSFMVTDQPHEEPKAFNLMGREGQIGEGTIMTGTLINTNEGDVIQAQANVSLHGVSGFASLVMSLDSTMAKSIVNLEKSTPDDLFLMPFDLKCIAN